MNLKLIVHILAGFVVHALTSCTHLGGLTLTPATPDKPHASIRRVCIEARSEERRLELKTTIELALADLACSTQAGISNDQLSFITAAVCNEEALRHTLIVALPNIRSIDESFERATKFRRPHLMRANHQCVSNHGPLYFASHDTQRGNTKLFFSPFVHWMTGIGKELSPKTTVSGDEGLEAYCQALLLERSVTGTESESPNDLGAYTPSIELYPIALEGLRESLSQHGVAANPCH